MSEDEEENRSNLFDSYGSNEGSNSDKPISKQDSIANQKMHEMMMIDGEDFEAFAENNNSDKSISLISLDYDPANIEGEENDWSHGQYISTLLFPSNKLQDFEKEQLDLKISKP